MGRPAAYPDSVRIFARVVGVGLFAGSVVACGLVTGLNGYSSGEAAPDASTVTTHDSGPTNGHDGTSASDDASDATAEDATLPNGDGGPFEDGDAEPVGDASEDVIEEGEDGGEATDGAATTDAGDAAPAHDASPETGAPQPDAGCGTPDTLQNCGACGVSCTTAHSTDAGCFDGVCSYTCGSGYANCDPTGANTGGCSTPTNTTTNCSGCGVACSTTTGTPTCNGTTCMYACSPGTADCNKTTPPDTDGCETATNTTAHCAGCSPCDTTTGTPSCNGTTCSYQCSSSALLDCNAATAPDLDGCETSALSTSTCGGCLNKCGASNGTTFSSDSCDGTTCSYACSSGHYDCNKATPPDTDGCETAEGTSNCGGCGQACGSGTGGAGTYTADTCSTSTNSCSYTCATNHYDCNKTTAPNLDGCETAASTTNCGACGQQCGTTNGTTFSGDTCVNGSCSYSCDTGRQDCNVGTAPDLDGCECAGTGCCGTGCQTQHSNGEGQNYYDCSGLNTHSQAEAQAACQANGGTCTQSQTGCNCILFICGSQATAYCNSSYCWAYGSVGSGNVTSGSSAACSGNTATWN
jgi:hypothetical protein